MATTLTVVPGSPTVWGNKRCRVYDVVFSSNYATGGESITAAAAGLRKIEQVIPNGNVAISTDLATANPVGFRVASAGTSVLVTTYEGSAAGTALSEKGVEAYATGATIRVSFIGY